MKIANIKGYSKLAEVINMNSPTVLGLAISVGVGFAYMLEGISDTQAATTAALLEQKLANELALDAAMAHADMLFAEVPAYVDSELFQTALIARIDRKETETNSLRALVEGRISGRDPQQFEIDRYNRLLEELAELNREKARFDRLTF